MEKKNREKMWDKVTEKGNFMCEIFLMSPKEKLSENKLNVGLAGKECWLINSLGCGNWTQENNNNGYIVFAASFRSFCC